MEKKIIHISVIPVRRRGWESRDLRTLNYETSHSARFWSKRRKNLLIFRLSLAPSHCESYFTSASFMSFIIQNNV
ncbi:MAG: hypothetical protein A2W65_00800 [Candidatus Taylorbacteria bacterium RIFCSPLOWO2_02_50_13]|nr:MAG: hypothetical protein A2W65_00800 [Candidatus Taylorbacteria bacterium RIFCSPLOWO2_02_50_13]